VFLKFAHDPEDLHLRLKACGVPRGAACGAGDPGCRSATECDTLMDAF
jgi:hypothetical protein